MIRFRTPALSALALLLIPLAGCDDAGPTEPVADAPVLQSVVPHGGATDVDPGTDVELEFDHPLMPGMEAYADLHEGPLTGPEVPGVWRLSGDGMRLTFSPDQPLKPHTDYTIHVGGGMMGAGGQPADLQEHGPGMGGDWATQEMMGGGPGSGMNGGMGHQGQEHHMGDGWQHPGNGSYGMVFPFITGG